METCTICSNHDNQNRCTQQEDCALNLTEKLFEHYRQLKKQLTNTTEENTKLKRDLEDTNVKLTITELDYDKLLFKTKKIKLEVAGKQETIESLQQQLKSFEQMQQENDDLKKQVTRLTKIVQMNQETEPTDSHKRRKANSFDDSQSIDKNFDAAKNKSESDIPSEKVGNVEFTMCNDAMTDEESFFIDSPPPKDYKKIPEMPLDDGEPKTPTQIIITTDLPKRKKLLFSSTKKKIDFKTEKPQVQEKSEWKSKLQLINKSAADTVKPSTSVSIAKNDIETRKISTLRQSMLNFTKSDDKTKHIFNDETFCEELDFTSKAGEGSKWTSAKPISRQTKLKVPSSEDEGFFNFSKNKEKTRPDKREKENFMSPKKVSPKKIKQEPIVNTPAPQHVDCSSVMIIPNADTEIISLDTQEDEQAELNAILKDTNSQSSDSFVADEDRSLAYEIFSIRTNKANKKQPRWDCDECRKYYQARYPNMGPTQLQQVKDNCSRHRKPVNLHVTPVGFWDPCFSPTQDS